MIKFVVRLVHHYTQIDNSAAIDWVLIAIKRAITKTAVS
jgi:hypothetical protein